MLFYQGYRFEGLPVLVIWTAFLILVFVFHDEVRELRVWAFLLLMVLVVGLCVAGEYIFYRSHTRSPRRAE